VNVRSLANQSIRWLYVLTVILIVITFLRLFFDFSPRIDINPETKSTIRAPFLAIPNIGPIAREAWIKKTLRNCLSFTSKELDERITDCSQDYFDIRAQKSFQKIMPRTTFGQYMLDNPNTPGEVQAVNTKGPYLIYEGSRDGLFVWRYQTEVMTTLFIPGRTATRRWLIDSTMTFDTPDTLYFSGFRFLSFYMKERI
jgi:hypothetical protein